MQLTAYRALGRKFSHSLNINIALIGPSVRLLLRYQSARSL